jgi:hypothetical protein
VQHGEQRPFRAYRRVSSGVAEGVQHLSQLTVGRADLHGECSLTWRWRELIRVECLG